jgi:lipoyl(octanoyl) transferase
MIAADLGLIEYETALTWQLIVHEKRINAQVDDIIILLEHPQVITIGKSGTEQDLLLSINELTSRNIPVRKVGRGGKITCHYPGQMVVYVIMDLRTINLDIPKFVYKLEDVIIATLGGFNIIGERIEKLRGIFVKGKKIASIGVEIKKGISMHGISLNVFEDKGLYDCFVPCGIQDRGVEFLERIAPKETLVSMDVVKHMFLNYFIIIFSQSNILTLSRQEFEERILCMDGNLINTVSWNEVG